MPKPSSRRNKTPQPKAADVYYFMATLLVIYTRDGKATQRHMNILAELGQPMILKSDLGQIHTAALGRLRAETEIDLDNVQDVIVLNCIPLAFTTPDIFHGTE